MEPLLWTCLLGFSTIRAMPSGPVSQTTRAISMTTVNSSTEIQCTAALPKPVGLSLRRRFSGEIELLYLSLETGKQTVAKEYQGKLSMTGQCCNFTLHLSRLKLSDTDSYYCVWSQMDSKTSRLTKHRDSSTIIIVRERDPTENCNRNVSTLHILFILSVAVSVVILSALVGAFMWCCSRTRAKYQPPRANQQRQRLCSQCSVLSS